MKLGIGYMIPHTSMEKTVNWKISSKISNFKQNMNLNKKLKEPRSCSFPWFTETNFVQISSPVLTKQASKHFPHKSFLNSAKDHFNPLSHAEHLGMEHVLVMTSQTLFCCSSSINYSDSHVKVGWKRKLWPNWDKFKVFVQIKKKSLPY